MVGLKGILNQFAVAHKRWNTTKLSTKIRIVDASWPLAVASVSEDQKKFDCDLTLLPPQYILKDRTTVTELGRTMKFLATIVIFLATIGWQFLGRTYKFPGITTKGKIHRILHRCCKYQEMCRLTVCQICTWLTKPYTISFFFQLKKAFILLNQCGQWFILLIECDPKWVICLDKSGNFEFEGKNKNKIRLPSMMFILLWIQRFPVKSLSSEMMKYLITGTLAP